MVLDENDKPIHATPETIRERTGITLRSNGVEFPREFLEDVFKNQADKILNALNEVYDIDKKFYLKTMMEIGKLVIPKETKKTDTRVNVNADIKELANLSAMKDARPIIEAAPITDEFEEIPSASHPDVTDDIASLLGKRKEDMQDGSI